MLTCHNISIRECISLRAIQKSDCDEFNRENIPLDVLSFSTVGDCYGVAPLTRLSLPCGSAAFGKCYCFYQHAINAESGCSRNYVRNKTTNYNRN